MWHLRWCRGRRPTRISRSTSEASPSQVSIEALHRHNWAKKEENLHTKKPEPQHLASNSFITVCHKENYVHWLFSFHICLQARLVSLWSLCLPLWTASCRCAKVGPTYYPCRHLHRHRKHRHRHHQNHYHQHCCCHRRCPWSWLLWFSLVASLLVLSLGSLQLPVSRRFHFTNDVQTNDFKGCSFWYYQ